VDKSESLTASVAKLVSFRECVPWCGGHCRLQLYCVPPCALHGGTWMLDELSLTSLVPTSH
jgi:hypothetical protein